MGNYRVITAAAGKNEETGIFTGGTSIMVHGSIQKNIAQITRQRRRVLRVTLGQAKSKMPIHIISTYAPHNGHTEATKRIRWGDVKELLNKTCSRHLIIWVAVANGQIGNRNHEEEEKYAKKEHDDQRVIGPYAKARKPEKEMDHEYAEYSDGRRWRRWQHGENQKLHDETSGNNKKAKRGRTGRKKTKKSIRQHGPYRMET